MGKKRNRQQDVTEENAGESTESCEEPSTGAKSCQHVGKAIDLTKVKKALKISGVARECSECVKLGGPPDNEEDDEDKGYEPVIPVLWICLRCGAQGCGRGQRQHAIEHYKTPRSDCHCLVLDTHRWSLWCYQCETEINADCKKKLLELVEFVKKQANFGIPKPPPGPPLPTITLRYDVEENGRDMSIGKKQSAIPTNLSRIKGLSNLGNTCFMNAVLQCLAQTPFLVKVLEDLKEPGEKFSLPGGKFKPSKDAEEIDLPSIEGSLDGWGSVTALLYKTLTDMQAPGGSEVYTPSQLLRIIASKLPQFGGGDQHDSHELLRHLLELVRNEDLRRYQSIILKQVGLSEKTNPQVVEENLKARVKFYGIQAGARLLGPERVFRGVLVSTLECLECHHYSHCTEPFLDLSLPVMADKPQPPVLKRKNSGIEDTFDLAGNSTTDALLKELKKERRAMKRNRKNWRQRGPDVDYSLPNQNSITEEKQENNSESESDADIEDNVESEAVSRPEVIESGYSSEKPSALASPVSPLGSSPANDRIAVNNSLVDATPSSTDGSADSTNQISNINVNNTITPSPTDVSMTDLSQTKFNIESSSSEKMSIALTESPVSPENNATSNLPNWFLPNLSLPNSSAGNSGPTSPDGLTVSPLSSMTTSKDTPISPISSTIESPTIERNQNRPSSRLELTKPQTNEKDALSSRVPTRETNGGNLEASQRQDDKATRNLKKEHLGHNGIDEITSGLSRLATSSNGYQSPSRYPSEDGECSIQSCLNQFTALELMSGNNKVGCKACTARENKGKEGKMVCCPSTKQYLISRAPAVLILHLKRFQVQRVMFRKVTKHVAFPPTLDLAPVCRDHSGTRLYSLYGVVEHSGTLHGGHYVAYVKTREPFGPDDPRWSFLPNKDTKDTEDISPNINSDDSEGNEASARRPTTAEPPPGRWYYISDSRVMEVDETRVLQSQAYLLFYERIL